MQTKEEKSGSRKMLKFFGVLDIIFGILGLIFGIMIAGTGGIGAMVPETATDTSLQTGVAVLLVLGIFLIIAGIIDLIVGILSVRASNNPKKIMPVWVLALISLIVNVISVIYTIAQGAGTNVWSSIVSLAIAAIIFFVANNVKKEAKSL
ncbi:MAG: hypothetical protein IKD89_01010 [Clostridia bacterium]|nr:hypothetical protein [Clostridia bacterium]